MDSLAKSPPHHWQEDERLILCLIPTFFVVSKDETAALLNRVFAARLRAEGHLDGLRAATVNTMLYEIQHGRSHLEPWRTVRSLSLSRLRTKYWRPKNQIEDNAVKLGMELRLRVTRDRTVKSTFKARLQRTRRAASSREDTPSERFSLASDSEDSPCLQKQSRVARQTRRRVDGGTASNVKPLQNFTRFDGSLGPKHPTLLFRAFNNDHGFVSREWLQASTDDDNRIDKQPPPYRGPAFRSQVKRHLMIDVTFDSPFVSLTQYLKAAVKYLDGRVDCSLAVFDYGAIEKDAAERFGDIGIPYLVASICKDHEIDDLPQGYTGRGEWLVYGSTQAVPLVVWTLTEVQAIDRLLRNTRSMSFEDGVRLGRYFKRIPTDWQATLAFQMICAYKVEGYRSARNRTDFQEYIRGVYRGAVTHSQLISVGEQVDGLNCQLDQGNTAAIEDEVPYPSTRARNRRLIDDSDDDTTALHVQNTTSFTQIAGAQLQAFRDRLQQFVASNSNKDSVQIPHIKHTTSTPQTSAPRIIDNEADLNQSDDAVRQVVDLTGEDDDDNEDVIFQSIRQITHVPRALSIRSRSSTKHEDQVCAN